MKVIKRIAHAGLKASRPRPYRRLEAAGDIASYATCYGAPRCLMPTSGEKGP
jgi:hypothetical protein